MSIPQYQDNPVIDTTSPLDLKSLVGKSVIVTGGANGLGKAYSEVFVKAGAYVTIADFDDVAGKRTVGELGGAAQFVKCDVRNWDDQVTVFEAAVQNSPSKSCDVVIASAGIVGQDDLFSLQDPFQPAVKPDLRIIDINLIGMVYTTKLAFHYFRQQPEGALRDRCLILKGSIASYIDNPGSPQYNVSKWGARGLMRNLRRTAWQQGIRVNLVAPWYVRTPILSDATAQFLREKGVVFATVDDCANTMLRIASEKNINGRAFGVVPRKEAPSGHMDLLHDDYQSGDVLKEWQEIGLETAQSVVDLA